MKKAIEPEKPIKAKIEYLNSDGVIKTKGNVDLRKRKNRPIIEREISKEQIEKYGKTKALSVMQSLFNQAMGETIIFKRDGTRVITVRDPQEIEYALSIYQGGMVAGAYYFITTKQGDYRAGAEFLNRTFGKPKEISEVDHTVTFDLRALSIEAERIRLERGNKGISTPLAEK